MTFEEAKWSHFAGRLLGYIGCGTSSLVKTDYEVNLDMAYEDILNELQTCTKIEELSPELQRVALEFLEYSKWR